MLIWHQCGDKMFISKSSRPKNCFIRSCARMLALQQHDLASAMNCNALAMDIRPARRCSSCGQQGHNARTCLEKDDRARPLEQNTTAAAAQGDPGHSPNREMAAMSSVVGSGCQEVPAASLSGSDTQQGTTPSPHYARERRRGTPWTEEEHRAFLAGLEKLGKGDWRGISKDFVTSRTPTQVASHAQKYFIRHNNQSKRKRRTSLFDLKADAEAADTMRSRGSAEATSTNWPDIPTQQPAPISVQHVHKHIWQAPSQGHQHHASAVEHASAAQTRDLPSLQGQMWYPPSGPDFALVQHYMQMTGLPVETAMLQVMSYQAAAAQGVTMPSFPTFPTPSLADQLMAAYAAQAAAQFPASAFPPNAFPPCAPSDAQAPLQLAGLLPQQAAAAFALLNQQQTQHQAPQLTAAQHALAQLQPGVQHSRPPIPQIQTQEPAQHAQQAEGSSKSSPQPGCQTPSIQSESLGQHPVGKANGSLVETGHMACGGSNVAGSDPALCGHGRLYRPQASHAKAVAAPAVMRFGNFEESISRRSSSESIVPASGNASTRLDSNPRHQHGDALTSQPTQ